MNIIDFTHLVGFCFLGLFSMSRSTVGERLFRFDNAKMACIFEVFSDNNLNESLVSDESDEVVLFTPISPTMYSDRHKKKVGIPFDMST